MYIITATYKGKKIARKAFSDLQTHTIINALSREGAADIGTRKEES